MNDKQVHNMASAMAIAVMFFTGVCVLFLVGCVLVSVIKGWIWYWGWL